MPRSRLAPAARHTSGGTIARTGIGSGAASLVTGTALDPATAKLPTTQNNMRQAEQAEEPAAAAAPAIMPTSASLLIAAPHAIARSGLRRILELDGRFHKIDEASDLQAALVAVRQQRLAAALVYMDLPPTGGLEAMRQLLEAGDHLAVVVIAASGDSNLAMRALDAGAIGFLTEHCSGADIAEAAHRATEGKPFLTQQLLQEVALRRVAASRDPVLSLSPREYEIFRMLASGRTVNEVALALRLSPRSVANYQTQIKRKLGVGTSAELVHLAIRRGVVQAGQP